MRKIHLLVALSTFFAALVFTPQGNALDEYSDEVEMMVGDVKVFPTTNPTRVAVGNPQVADVTSVTKTEITLTSKAAGRTTLMFWDTYGEQSYQIKVYAENLNELKRRIDTVLKQIGCPQLQTNIEEESGKVIIMGEVVGAAEKEKITTALGIVAGKYVDLIQVREEQTVIEIDVQVLELDKDATNTLGFSWPGSITLEEVTSPSLTDTGTKWSTLFKVSRLSREAFSWSLDALIQEGKARLLSRPRIACQTGKEASLLVGGEKPIMTTLVSDGGTGTSVDYKEYGIKLKVKPEVTKERRIKLSLDVEVSEVGAAEVLGKTSEPTARAYPLVKRTASTQLYLNDNQTMAIGGLVKQKQEEEVRKTPILGDIPIIGAAFRKKTTRIGGGEGERGNNELFISMTPRIVSDDPAKPAVKTGAAPDEGRQLYAESDSSVTEYIGLVQKRILDSIQYPRSARDAGFQGTVRLTLKVSFAGELLDCRLKDSSGYKVLDDQALETAKGIPAYPPFPPSFVHKEMWVDVPIVYRLD